MMHQILPIYTLKVGVLRIRTFYPNSANDPDRANRTAAAAGGNTGDNVGSYQAGQVPRHAHTFNVGGGGSNNFSNFYYGPTDGYVRDMGGATVKTKDTFMGQTNIGVSPGSAITSDDNRPPNLNFYLIVKYQ